MNLSLDPLDTRRLPPAQDLPKSLLYKVDGIFRVDRSGVLRPQQQLPEEAPAFQSRMVKKLETSDA